MSPAIAYEAGTAAAVDGDWAAAKRYFEAFLARHPRDIEARHDLGVVMLREGRPAAAIEQLRAVVGRNPSHPGAWLNMALAHCELGDAEAARAAATRAVTVAPRIAAAEAALGHALAMGGDLEGAENAYRCSLALDANATAVMTRYAAVLRRLGRLEESLSWCERLLVRRPDDLGTQSEKLFLLMALNVERVMEQRRTVSVLAAADRSGLRRICHVLAHEGRHADALTLADAAVESNLDVADFRADRASILHGTGRIAEALDDLKQALSLDPTNPDVLFGIGRLFEQCDQPAAAAPFFLQVLEHRPDSADAYVHLAEVKAALGETAQSTALLRHAISLAPDRHWLTADLSWNRLMSCDWDGLDGEFRQSLDRHLANGLPFPPFTLLAMGLPNADLLLWTRAWAEGKVDLARARPVQRTKSPGRARIRLGYLSADFKDHATLLLILGLFEAHDRSRFEVFGYNIGPIDDSARCRRAIRALDHFVDLVPLKDEAAAQCIAADGIDILLDLKGYTKHSRPGILAHRPAPIQVNYLGYPGSMATAAVDYIIADRVVVPDDHRSFYDEAVVYLPHSYQPNDRHRAGADPGARRDAHGLPPDGFVFCCFNSNYKITPMLFDIWMRLICSVPDSVLWLMSMNGEVEANLRREAVVRGVSDARLVFAPRVGFEAHIGRMALADLFLDTLPVCAHTTASEALWAGLPVLTCLGPHFVGRVAGSLITAVGLPELITTSLADYEREALALARDPERLGALRDRLARNRLTAPLFDTPRYVRNYEAALERMVALRLAGQPPQAFAVADHGGNVSSSAPPKEKRASSVCRAVPDTRQIENTHLLTGLGEALL